MSFGVEVKNKNNRLIFGAKHLSIMKVASGYIDPATYKSSTGTVTNVGSVTLPNGVTRHNSLIFARPELTEEYKQLRPDGLTDAPWALALTYVNDNMFTLQGTDSSISYYDGQHGDKSFSFTQSFQCWTDQNFSGMLPARVYYEVWVQGSGSEEETSHGLKIIDSNTDMIFDSNRPFFKTESTIKGRPNIEFDFGPQGPRINHGQTSYMALNMLQRSKVSQELYLVCLNGTAHTSAIVLGGPTSPVTPSSVTSSGKVSGYEVPRAPLTGYYRNFVEFHYAIEDDLFRAQPHIRMVQRLERTKNNSTTTTESYYNTEPRYNEEVGVPACLLIGKSS